MSWFSDELHHALAQLRDRGGDSTLIEAKRAGDGIPQLAQSLCAFGNMPTGGTILLGVDESRNFAITGVTDIAGMEAGVAAQARTGVTPPVQIDFDLVESDGHRVVVVSVAPLPLVDKPCRTHGKAYLRQADGDYVMSDQEVAQLLALQERPRYDATAIPGSSTNDLDKDLVTSFLEEARSASRRLADRSDSDILRLRGVVAGDCLTLAGAYALGSYPQQFAPSLSVTAAAAPENAGQRMADLAHLDGPIPDLLEQSLEWVRRNTRNAVVFDAYGNGTDQPEIPHIAVRELVANALVHRDLSPRTQSKRVEIRLLPDRLVIASPGGLWGVSRDQLGEPGGKSAVNEYLYELSQQIKTPNGHRIIEGEGGGIREAREALARVGLPQPVFIDTGVSFTAIVYRRAGGGRNPSVATPQATRATKNQTLLMTALGDGPSSSKEIAKRTGLTARQVQYAITKLQAQGLITMNGGHGQPGTTYAATQ